MAAAAAAALNLTIIRATAVASTLRTAISCCGVARAPARSRNFGVGRGRACACRPAARDNSKGPPQGARDSIAPETPTRSRRESSLASEIPVDPGKTRTRARTRESVATGRDRGRRRSRDVSLKSPSAKKTSPGTPRRLPSSVRSSDARDVLVTRASFPDVAGKRSSEEEEESLAQGAKRGRDEEREQRRRKRDGERENGRHAVILREFSLTWVGVTARVSSVSVGGSETERGGGAALAQGASRTEGGEREGERASASERVGRLVGTVGTRNASVERAFICASSCLYYAPLSELSSEISNGCQRATA